MFLAEIWRCVFIGSSCESSWRMADFSLSDFLWPVINLVALFWTTCSFFNWFLEIVFRGMVGYRRADRTVVVYRYLLQREFRLRNLLSFVRVCLAAAVLVVTWGMNPLLLKFNPSTFPWSVYGMILLLTLTSSVFIRPIFSSLNLSTWVCIFHLFS